MTTNDNNAKASTLVWCFGSSISHLRADMLCNDNEVDLCYCWPQKQIAEFCKNNSCDMPGSNVIDKVQNILQSSGLYCTPFVAVQQMVLSMMSMYDKFVIAGDTEFADCNLVDEAYDNMLAKPDSFSSQVAMTIAAISGAVLAANISKTAKSVVVPTKFSNAAKRAMHDKRSDSCKTTDVLVKRGLDILGHTAIFTPKLSTASYKSKLTKDLLRACHDWFTLLDWVPYELVKTINKPIRSFDFAYDNLQAAKQIDVLLSKYIDRLTFSKVKYALIQTVISNDSHACAYANLSVDEVIKELTMPTYQYHAPDENLIALLHEAVFIKACKQTNVKTVLVDELLLSKDSTDSIVFTLGEQVTALPAKQSFELLCKDLSARFTCKVEAKQPDNQTDTMFNAINNLRDSVFALAKSQGKYEMHPNIAPLLMHLLGETNEAHTAFTANCRAANEDVNELVHLLECNNVKVFAKYFKSSVKSTFEDELADIMLMCLSIAGYYNVDLSTHVRLKHAYNAVRTEHSSTNNYNK